MRSEKGFTMKKTPCLVAKNQIIAIISLGT